MPTESTIFFLALLLSIPYGLLVKSSSPAGKQCLSLAAGISILLLLVGFESMIHSFVTILVSYFVVRLTGSRYCRETSSLFVFGYLIFFRISSLFGLTDPPARCYTVQVVVSMRMLNVAFECYNAYNHEKMQKRHFSASLLDFFVYGYCYIGLLVGPFYTYSVFQDMIQQDGTKIATARPALHNLKYLPVITLLFIWLASSYPLNYIGSEECLNHSYGILYQLWVLWATFSWFRWKFYIVWMLGESTCIVTGLGAYPLEWKCQSGQAPDMPFSPDSNANESKKQINVDAYNFKTIQNVSIQRVEFASSLEDAMLGWNMTVQWWMKTHICKHLPIKSNQVRRLLMLFLFAFWNGSVGYCVTFTLSLPLLVTALSGITNAIKPYLNEKQCYWWDWVMWFCFYRLFEYFSVGLMLLKWDLILRVWMKMYFIGHIFVAVLIVAAFCIPTKTNEDRKMKIS